MMRLDRANVFRGGFGKTLWPTPETQLPDWGDALHHVPAWPREKILLLQAASGAKR